MPNDQFIQLLESSEGLTDGFKSNAAALFEEAVNQAVAAQIDQQLDACRKQCADEAAAEIEHLVEQRLDGRIAEQRDTLYREAAEHGAKIINEQLATAKSELTESLNGQYAEKYDALLKEAAEAKAALETESAKYSRSVSDLMESVEKLAADKAAEQLVPICEKLVTWADYVAEQYVNAHEQQIVNETKGYIGESIVERIKDLFEQFGCELPSGHEAIEKQIADLTAERDQAYADLAESIEARQAVEQQLFEARKSAALAAVTESLAATDRAKVIKLMEGVEGDLESFVARAKLLAETVSTADAAEPSVTLTEAVTVTDTPPTLAEAAPEPPTKPEQYVNPDQRDVDMIVASLRNLRINR